jgi:hypothetical protein
MTTNPQKITFGEMRASGVLIYCRDHRCSHHGEIRRTVVCTARALVF